MSVTAVPAVGSTDERRALLLSGAFTFLATACACVSVLVGVLMALDSDAQGPGVLLVLLVYSTPGLVVAALLLFFGYVLALLVGIHRRVGRIS